MGTGLSSEYHCLDTRSPAGPQWPGLPVRIQAVSSSSSRSVRQDQVPAAAHVCLKVLCRLRRQHIQRRSTTSLYRSSGAVSATMSIDRASARSGA